ncbi:MAG TPA: Xaa-Pro peptidase family protein [Phototrophicaceae bacterium]|nr:Xaa-Pro peptidase family protein [Phototrophicaceae bacterium]
MSVPIKQLRISPEEHQARCDLLLEHLQVNGLSGVVLFDNAYVLYYSGFSFIPTERPMAFIMSAKGERGLFVPRLEKEHAEANSLIDRVDYYVEYPHTPHPTGVLKRLLESMGIIGDMDAKIAADDDGYPWIFGYRGPSLSELTGRQIVPVRAFIEDRLMCKSPAELALIRESCVWGNLAHTLLQRYTVPGATETEVSQRATDESTRALMDAIGPIYRAQSTYGTGASAGYRGQIGRNAAIPHALANNITFRDGDVLVTGAGATMWGYNSELERTMVIGKPSAEVKTMFEHMLALQETAFDAIKPGEPCSEVDRKVRAYYEQHDLMPYWKHHVGHNIGLRYHEAPFLDIGDTTILQPGMLFTVEPGLYAPSLGGFRHSDTIVVTDTGIEIYTYYPRDLESLTILA